MSPRAGAAHAPAGMPGLALLCVGGYSAAQLGEPVGRACLCGGGTAGVRWGMGVGPRAGPGRADTADGLAAFWQRGKSYAG